jgi:hypothetical protein
LGFFLGALLFFGLAPRFFLFLSFGFFLRLFSRSFLRFPLDIFFPCHHLICNKSRFSGTRRYLLLPCPSLKKTFKKRPELNSPLGSSTSASPPFITRLLMLESKTPPFESSGTSPELTRSCKSGIFSSHFSFD